MKLTRRVGLFALLAWAAGPAAVRAAGADSAAARAATGPGTPNAAAPTTRSDAALRVVLRRDLAPPDIALLGMNRKASTLRKELDTAEPVIVNFVFTTCATICSTQTATLAALQRQLAESARPARFLTFTIDPDNDTPEQLAKFARQFSVGPGWQFFTGKFDDLLRQQQAFDVYRGAKAGHPPVVMMRHGRAAPWVRIEGYPSPQELRRAYEQLPVS
jgi:protein SCO1